MRTVKTTGAMAADESEAAAVVGLLPPAVLGWLLMVAEVGLELELEADVGAPVDEAEAPAALPAPEPAAVEGAEVAPLAVEGAEVAPLVVAPPVGSDVAGGWGDGGTWVTPAQTYW